MSPKTLQEASFQVNGVNEERKNSVVGQDGNSLDCNSSSKTARSDFDSARLIVSSILDQITLNDSPPMNDAVITLDNAKFKHRIRPLAARNSNGEKYLYQKPNLLKNSAPASHHLSDTSITSSDSSTYHGGHELAMKWQDQCMHREEREETKIGHRALAILCYQTLEVTEELEIEYNGSRIEEHVSLTPSENQENLCRTLQKERSTMIPSRSSSGVQTHDLNEETQTDLISSLLMKTHREIPNRDPPGNNLIKPGNDELPSNPEIPTSKKILNGLDKDSAIIGTLETDAIVWDEGLLSSLSPEDDSDEEDIHCFSTVVSDVNSKIGALQQQMQLSESKIEGGHQHGERLLREFSVPAGNKYESEFKRGPRLQMYGSEYARFLSDTVFAPEVQHSFRNTNRSREKTAKHQPIEGRFKNQVATFQETNNAISTGAITDIVITRWDTLPPKGYYRMSQTIQGGDFRELWPWGGHIYVKRERNWDRAAQRPCVSAITVIFPDRNEVVPPGFCVVSLYDKSMAGARPSKTYKKGMSDAANLNYGLDAERIYLCYRRSREGNPITGLMPLFPSLSDPIPEGYTVLERSPRNHVANLNPGGSNPVFLALRQRLASLEPLRPLSLLLSVQRDSLKNTTNLRSNALGSYYCTGGSTVVSKVGRLHIMDRSTHSLLSPSSIQSRMSLIHASRLKGESDGSTVSSIGMLGLVSSKDASSFFDEALIDEGGSFMSDSFISGNREDDTESASHFSCGPKVRERIDRKTFFTRKYAALDSYSSAFSFIPMVETPLTKNDQRKLESRIAIVTPILTACYTQHGGVALLAIEGLASLLSNTGFFDQDIVPKGDNEGCHCRLTLLDLAIQSVCDTATSTARETSFIPCIDFVKKAIKFSDCNLNPRTIGFVLRFYLFIFYFGASVPTSSTLANTVWKSTSESHNGSEIASDDIPFLHENAEGYYIGGAPQAAALALKELATLLLESISSAECNVREAKKLSVGDEDPLGNFIGGIVSSLVDNSVRRVDLANNTQLALHQIHRSGGSELFWYDMMMSCGSGLFGGISDLPQQVKYVCMIGFSFLANIVKASNRKIRQIPRTGELIPRDVANKLLSLELLCHCLNNFEVSVQREEILESNKAPEYQKESIKTIIYSMRRLVVPCLLDNTLPGLQDPRIFRRVIKIISEIWNKPTYRSRMKIELGVLMEQFVLRLMRLGPQLLPIKKMDNLKTSSLQTNQSLDSYVRTFQKPLFNQQIDILFEVSHWFKSDARSLMELFLNFDTNISQENEGQNHFMPGNHWKICEQLCDSICGIAEQCGEEIVEQIKESQVTNDGPLTPTGALENTSFFPASKKEKDNDLDERTKKIEKVAVRLAARQLQKASFTAICHISQSIAVVAAMSAGIEEETIVTQKYNVNASDALGLSNKVHAAEIAPRLRLDDKNEKILSYWETEIATERREGISKLRNAESMRKIRPGIETAFSATTLSSDRSKTDVILRTALNIAKTKNLKSAVAYLVTEKYMSPSPRDVAAFLRIHHNQFNAASLGVFLGEGGLSDAEVEYWNLIRFNYVRAISFVGLTVEEGLRHFLTNCGFKLPGEAQQIDRVITTFSQCYWEDNAGDYYRCPFEDQDTIFLLSFAIIMLNTDLHKVSRHTKSRVGRPPRRMTKSEFLNNLRGVAKNGELDKEYISSIYDSVEASPIELFEEPLSLEAEVTKLSAVLDESECDLGENLKFLIKNAKKSQELLRGLSAHDFRFYTIEDYAEYTSLTTKDALSDLSSGALTSTWCAFHNLIKTTIKNAQLDPEALVLSLSLLSSCLCSALCLEMKKEFNSFLYLLARVKTFAEKSTMAESIETQDWFSDLQSALESNNKVSGLEQILELVHELEECLQKDSMARKQITRITRRIQDGQFLLEDPTRFFVRDGEMMKRSNRIGRATKYIFFLFSDILLYAKPVSPSSEKCSIHEVLSLHLMTIVDWYPNSKLNNNKNFTIHHPRKSFVVLCKTEKERKSWVSAIRIQINESRRRAFSIATRQTTRG